MGLLLIRVDDRLVHGQVMVGWFNYLEATQVLVASDRLAANPLACSVLRLTAREGGSLVIDTVTNIVNRIKIGEFDKEKDILLFENLSDIIKALDMGIHFKELNLGGIRHQDSCVAFSPTISLSAADINNLREIIKRGVAISIQMLPNSEEISLDSEQLERRLHG